MLLCIFYSVVVLVLVHCSHVNSQTIVWDDYRDLCSLNEASFARERNRCEHSNDIIVERRLYRDDEPFWCISVNNSGKYNDINITFSGTKSSRTTDYGLYDISGISLIAVGDHFEHYNITSLRTPKFTIYPTSTYYDLQDITSIRLDGVEMCTGPINNSTNIVHPNQPNKNIIRFFKKCRLVDNRVHRPPNRCELMNQIIFDEMSFNGEHLFYCIVIDRTKNLFPTQGNDSVTIEFSNRHYISSWSRNNTRIVSKDRLTATYYVQSDVLYVSISPSQNTPASMMTNILSIKYNGRESCRQRIDPNHEYITCGVRKVNHQGLITFGHDTYHGKYPWHAALYQLTSLGTQNYICGGSLISANAIITAAHCVENTSGCKTADILRVQLGKWDLSISDSETKEFRVIQVIPHHDFDTSFLENDIAILKLENYVAYTKYIQPICLRGSKDKAYFINRIGFVPGWGSNHEHIQNTILHEAGMPIVPHQDCRRSKRNFFSNFLNENNFCAGFRNGTSVCEGDSGGGLVFKIETGWYLKGIVSLGSATKAQQCDIVEYVLFTDVTQFFDWIYNHLLVG